MSNTIQDLMIQLGMDTSELNDKVGEAWGTISDFAEKATGALEALGLALGFKELAQESLTAFGNLQKADVALTALTGDAALANQQITTLRALAMEDALSFPALLAANQRMVAMGFSTEQIEPALRGAADAAGALNTDIGTTTNAIERLALSGTAGARQLTQLGLSTADLAQVMGVGEDSVKAMFQALDQGGRLDVLTSAMDKFKGVAADVANTVPGQWQRLKTSTEELFESIGKVAAGAAHPFLDFADAIVRGTTSAVDGIIEQGGKLEAYLKSHKSIKEALFPGFISSDEQEQMDTFGPNAWQSAGIGIQFNPAAMMPEGQSFNLDSGAIQNRELDARLQKELTDAALKLAEAETSVLSPAQEELNARTQEQINYGDILKAQLADLVAMHNSYAKAVAASGLGTDYFAKKAMPEALAAMSAAMTEAPSVIDDFAALGLAGNKTADTLTQSLSKAKPPFDVLKEAISQIDKDLETGSFSQIDRIITKLAEDDLPTAAAQQDRFVAALEAANAPAQQLSKEIQKQIELHAQLGQSMNAEVIDLANLNEHQKIITATTNIWGRAYQGLLNDVNQFGSGLARTLAVGIVEGQKFGQVFSNIWKQFAEAILTTVITALEQLALKWIAGLIGITAIQKATDTSAIMGEGGRTFAAAFASVMEALPFPANVIAAPAVAGAETATMLGVALPMAAAAQGAFLTEDMVIAAGADELILPPNLSRGLSSMIDTNSRSGGSTGTAGAEPSTGLIDMRGSTFSGVTRDTIDALASAFVRQAIAARALRA